MFKLIFFQFVSLLLYLNFEVILGQNNFISKVNVNRSIENRGFHR
jgi:hypothetical protein